MTVGEEEIALVAMLAGGACVVFRRRGVGGWMEWGDARDGDAAVAGARGDDARTPDTNNNAVNCLR